LENENLAKGLNLIMAAIGGLPVGSDFQNWPFQSQIPSLFWWWEPKCHWFSPPNKVWNLELERINLGFQAMESPPVISYCKSGMTWKIFIKNYALIRIPIRRG
jgi:hypothetical protein